MTKARMKSAVAAPQWRTVKEYQDITYRKSGGVARIAFNLSLIHISEPTRPY